MAIDNKLKELVRKAEAGDLDSLVGLGLLHRLSKGVEKEDSKAAQWFSEAADKGSLEATYYLGVYYLETGNYAGATELILDAALRGHARAQTTLGYMYCEGEGFKQDFTEAAKWYRKAAEQGNPEAQVNLGTLHVDGLGVEKDITQAVQWFLKAAHQGNATAQLKVGILYFRGEGVELSESEAAKWFRKAAEQGNLDAQCYMGLLHGAGRGVAKDYEKSYFWFLLATKNGHETASAIKERMDSELTQKQRDKIAKKVRKWLKEHEEEELGRKPIFDHPFL